MDDPFGQKGDIGRVFFRQDNEFIAFCAHQHIASHHAVAQAGGQFQQKLVSTALSQRLHDLAKAVEVDDHDAEGRCRWPGGQFLHAAVEPHAVGQAGQPVGVGQADD